MRDLEEGIFELGRQLRERRQKLNISQHHLAELAGVTQATVINIEFGMTNPTYKNLLCLADALGLEIQLTPRQHKRELRA